MKKKKDASFFNLSFGFLFGNLKITYANETRSLDKNHQLELKTRQGRLKIQEGGLLQPRISQVENNYNFPDFPQIEVPIEKIKQLLGNLKGLIFTILGRIGLTLGIPV